MNENIIKIKKSVKITDYIKNDLIDNGDGWKCLSPFTKEKTPSFFIKEEDSMQFFKCFSSGKGGDIFSFLMELESKSFIEVYQELAEKLNLSIDSIKLKTSQKKYINILEKINLKLKFNLSEKEDVLNYLIEKRRFNKETINLFQLGWSESGILSYINAEKLDKDFSAEIGLIGKKDGYFDIIRNRITIPLFSINNEIIGIGTRKYLESDIYGKYILPPNSSLFKKNSFLYGLNFSYDEIKKKDAAILVEGNFDVIKLFQSGIKNIVGICGTTIYSTQVKLLQKLTNNFYICLDGDVAGYSAIIKNCKELIKQGIDIFIIELKDNLDPDEFIDLKGPREFIKLFNNAKNLFEFLADRKEELITILEELSLIIPKIESTIKQQFWYQNIEKYTGINIKNNIKKEYYDKKKTEQLTYNDTLFLKLFINTNEDGKKKLEENPFYETEFGKLLFLKLSNTNYNIEFSNDENEIINSIKSNKIILLDEIDKNIKKIKELKYLDKYA